MRTLSSLAIVALLTHATAAHAQPAITPPSAPPASTPSAAQPASVAEVKSPSVAVLLSLGVTAGGAITLMASDNESARWFGAAALFFGPSTGQWYAGEAGLLGLGARALGIAGLGYGLSMMLDSECDAEYGEDCTALRRRGTLGGVMFMGGVGLWVGSSIVDVILAKRAADRWNQRHALALAPTALTAGNSRAPGLVLTGRF
jgi:hypothetical protein